MQQVYTRSETICIYAAQVQVSHASIPPARTARPGLAAPCSRDTLLGCLGSRRGKKITYSRNCGKARLSPEKASSQIVLKLRPRPLLNINEWKLSTHKSITRCYSLSGSSKTAQGCPHTSCTKKRKEPKALPFPSTTVLTGLWTTQSVGQTRALVLLPCLSLPSHQATEDNRALPRKAKRCQLCNAVGKVPSSGNQFAARSTRFTTCFMSTYANIAIICPRYQVFLRLRPGFDLKVTYFFIAFTIEIIYSSELFNLS